MPLAIASGVVIIATICSALIFRKLAKIMQESVHASYDDVITDEEAENIKDLLERMESERLEDSNKIVVAIVDDMAYWVGEEGLMYAPVMDDEEVDFDSAMRYNVFEVPTSELNKLLFILDTIMEE